MGAAIPLGGEYFAENAEENNDTGTSRFLHPSPCCDQTAGKRGAAQVHGARRGQRRYGILWRRLRLGCATRMTCITTPSPIPCGRHDDARAPHGACSPAVVPGSIARGDGQERNRDGNTLRRPARRLVRKQRRGGAQSCPPPQRICRRSGEGLSRPVRALRVYRAA